VQDLLRQFGAKPSGDSADTEDSQPQLLAHACKAGKLKAVEQLVSWLPESKKGPAVQSALIPAAVGGHADVLEALLAANADPASSQVDEKTGTTPLIAAAGADDCSIKAIRWLLAHGADPTLSSKDGATPLMSASLGNFIDVVEVLLQGGADINQASPLSGWTALMVACQQGRPQVVKKLLDAHADPQPTNSDGSTARELAVSNSNHECLKAMDLRAKLNERRDKASSKAKATPGGEARDDRSLDDLLAGLEDQATADGGKGKKNKPAAKRTAQPGKAAPSKEEAAPKSAPKAAPAPKTSSTPAESQAETKPKSKAKAAAGPAKEASAEATPAPAAAASPSPAPAASTKSSAKSKEVPAAAVAVATAASAAAAPAAAAERSEAGGGDARLAFLQERLDALRRMREMIESEEATISEEMRRLQAGC